MLARAESRAKPAHALGAAALLLVTAICAALVSSPRAVGAPAKAPRILNGQYGEGPVYMIVDRRSRSIRFHFTLPCTDVFADLTGTSGRRPVRGELGGTRVGASAWADGIHTGPDVEAPETSITVWGVVGRFTARDEFRGRVEFEVGGVAPRARPQCLESTRIRLRRGQPGYARSL